MSSARALLRRLLSRRRSNPDAPAERSKDDQGPPAQDRLEAARQRLKETIPPPEGVSPEEGSSPGAREPK